MTTPIAHHLKTCWRSARPPFLVLAPLCAGLAVTGARVDGHAAAGLDIALVLLAALLAHAAVNLFNEHHDFESGLDALTERTPFSGGSGALIERPEAAVAVRLAAHLCLATVVVIGAWFTWRSGPLLLLHGLIGVGLVVAYTGWLTRRPWLCLLAPGVGFGTLMVVGSYQALTGGVSATALAVSLPPMLLVSALLLANQLPDIAADRRVGRYHLAIALGVPRAARGVAALVLAAFLVVPPLVAAAWLPAAAWLMWLALPAALWLARGLWRLPPRARASDVSSLASLLGLNVGVLLASLGLLNLGLWLAG
ncbi:prenyltransferase [Halomonas sp. NO4]|uniref:prenyltransferase n=1 Tax=Halomonas sp. NO4 TaxID=2484813 RepID=UPI0013D07CFC|nr:prenyltransferase [Halomonas sp. NO4]